MYLSKAGGKDVLGNYTGEMVLNMEPDLDSAKKLAEREGAELLAMLFKHYSEAKNISFEVVKYSPETRSKLMKENNPDNPLLQINNPAASIDALAITRVTFEATQEPAGGIVREDNTVGGGAGGGGKTSVTVPVEISVEGATVYCHIYGTVHPLGRSFKGVITGDVIGGKVSK